MRPKVGIERIDRYAVDRKLGVEPPASWPRYGEIDRGMPTFAVCGEVGLSGGPTILGAAAIRMNAGPGVATYADRPTVFRAFGTLYVVEVPLAKAAFELHTDGYVKARADFAFAIPDIASLEGFLKFEMLGTKSNAEAYVRACVDLVDLCAGARGLISSKGIAVCLHIEVLGGEWSPGSATSGGTCSRRRTSPAATSATTASTSCTRPPRGSAGARHRRNTSSMCRQKR